MRNTLRILLLAAATAVTMMASAAEPEELTCGTKFDKADDVNRCLSEALTLTERDLETMRQGLLKALEIANAKLQNVPGASTRPADAILEKAQKVWREFRETNCNYYDHAYAGVSSPGTEQTVCELRMTRQRMLELNSERQFWVYKFREADMPAQGDAK